MGKVTSEDVSRARVEFYSTLWGSLAVCVSIQWCAPWFIHEENIRLALVIAFFACLASATWSFSTPYKNYLKTIHQWRYHNAGPAVKHNIQRYVIRRTQYIEPLALLATTAVCLLGLWVLSDWEFFDLLEPFRSLFQRLALILVLLIPVTAAVNLHRLQEARAIKRQFEEELQVTGVTVHTDEMERVERRRQSDPAISITGPLAFSAGGYEWLWGDFYKNAAIFGQSGTGKTICVLNALLDGLIGSSSEAGLPASGLVLDPKGDYREKIDILCRRYGRESDLMVVDPYDLNRSIAWNPIDSDDDALELAGRFGAVMEILNPSSGDDAFWIDSSKRLVQHLITLFRYAQPDVPPSLIDIYEAAMSDHKLDECGNRIDDQVFDENTDIQRTFDFFFEIWKPMPDNTKGSIRSFVSNMLGSFLTLPYDQLFSGSSTITVASMIEQGKILYVHMPIADKETMSRVVSTFVKLEFYREVLKRPNKERPSFFLCDEFQSFFTVGQGRGDADAFERTRQSNHANIVAFQNLNALFKQTERKEPVLNMLGNCAIKVFLRNTDKDTNVYASELFGEHIETLSSSSVSVNERTTGMRNSESLSGSAQYAARIKKDEFSALAVPSKEDGNVFAESIAHLASRSSVETHHLKWKVHPITQG